MRHLRWVIPLLIIAGAVIAASAMFSARARGVEAVIRNTGTGDMREVRVVVTGQSYAIGDLSPSQSRAVRVNPTGESHIVLIYADANGVAKQLTVDCYLEPGYSGSIIVDVADGAVTKVDDRITI